MYGAKLQKMWYWQNTTCTTRHANSSETPRKIQQINWKKDKLAVSMRPDAKFKDQKDKFHCHLQPGSWQKARLYSAGKLQYQNSYTTSFISCRLLWVDCIVAFFRNLMTIMKPVGCEILSLVFMVGVERLV